MRELLQVGTDTTVPAAGGCRTDRHAGGGLPRMPHLILLVASAVRTFLQLSAAAGQPTNHKPLAAVALTDIRRMACRDCPM